MVLWIGRRCSCIAGRHQCSRSPDLPTVIGTAGFQTCRPSSVQQDSRLAGPHWIAGFQSCRPSSVQLNSRLAGRHRYSRTPDLPAVIGTARLQTCWPSSIQLDSRLAGRHRYSWTPDLLRLEISHMFNRAAISFNFVLDFCLVATLMQGFWWAQLLSVGGPVN